MTSSLQRQQKRWRNNIIGGHSIIFYRWLWKIDYPCGRSCFFNTSQHVTNRSQKYFTEIKVSFSFYHTSHTSKNVTCLTCYKNGLSNGKSRNNLCHMYVICYEVSVLLLQICENHHVLKSYHIWKYIALHHGIHYNIYKL